MEETLQFEGMMNYSYEDTFGIEDILNRRLYINGEINDEVANAITYHIMRYNMMDADAKSEDREPIQLYINSCGGDVNAGLSIVSMIQCSDTPVVTINMGKCDSMAFVIFIVGDIRYSLPYSEFLLHDGQMGAIDSTNKLIDRVKFEEEKVEALIRQTVINNTKIGLEKYVENQRKEWYFLPNEAKNYGICDFVIGFDCKLSDIC